MRFGIILDGAVLMTINLNTCGQGAPDISTVTHTPELSAKLGEVDGRSETPTRTSPVSQTLPNLWSSCTKVYGRGSRHCYAIEWVLAFICPVT